MFRLRIGRSFWNNSPIKELSTCLYAPEVSECIVFPFSNSHVNDWL